LGQGPVAGILKALATARGTKVASGHVGDTTEAAQIQSITAQLAELDLVGRPQKIFVCDGGANLALAIALAEPASILCCAVATGELDGSAMFERELNVFFVAQGHPDLLPEAAALVVKGEIVLDEFLVSRPLGPTSPAESKRAFDEGKCLVAHHPAQ